MAAGIFIFLRHSETYFELKLQNFAVKSNSENRFTFVWRISELFYGRKKR